MDSTSAPNFSRATRSSLACLPCRSRHKKCDGNQPNCARCTEVGQQCRYMQSRRGALHRASLAERRKRLALPESNIPLGDSSPRRFAATQEMQGDTDVLETGFFHPCEMPHRASVNNENSDIPIPLAAPGGANNIENDALIDSYYKHFHKFHPFLIPQKHLSRIYKASSRLPGFIALTAAVRLIGNVFLSQKLSIPLKNYTESCILQALPSDPIMVQCRLLYSMALFWYDYKDSAKLEMDSAISLAIDLEMFSRDFAETRGGQDPLVKESWRRTWWMLYVVHLYYAGTQGIVNGTILNIDSTVELPCEELEYESGNIPIPKTLQEFDCREFASDNIEFSSFAYLIGAVRCAATSMLLKQKSAGREDSIRIIQAIDCSLDGWQYLLPKDRKQIMTKTGDIDELMFQAHLLVHVTFIGLHRPFSDLKFSPVENVSSCAREPPLNIPLTELVNVHTVRVLRSVDAQIRLLSLPVPCFHHTPFTTCMVSEGTLALLSACHFLLKGQDLAVARDQIRMTLGCLKALGELWPRTARNVQEIQIIARQVLGIGLASDQNLSNSHEALYLGEDESLDSEAITSSNTWNIIPNLNSMEDFCELYNIENHNDFPWF